MPDTSPYTIYPLGETALTVDWGNRIDEALNIKMLQLFEALKKNPLPGMIEAVPAYFSLTVYYDVYQVKNKSPGEHSAFDFMSREIRKFLDEQSISDILPARTLRIPVCYDEAYGTDLSVMTAAISIDKEKIIRLHTSATYRVFMIGFLPGFPYMGMVNERISMPRKSKPVKVKAGSVGIAGRQTGIYPVDSPGGWQIIGRTPWKLFDHTKENPALLKPGDRVQFYSISRDEFEDHQSRVT